MLHICRYLWCKSLDMIHRCLPMIPYLHLRGIYISKTNTWDYLFEKYSLDLQYQWYRPHLLVWTLDLIFQTVQDERLAVWKTFLRNLWRWRTFGLEVVETGFEGTIWLFHLLG
jgi:hypothetical protein